MKTDLMKWVLLFAGLLIISSSLGIAQEADPQQRLNQVNVELIKLEGMIEYNSLVRNEAAKLYSNLIAQREKLSGLRDTITKKIAETKKAEAAKSVADPVETPDIGVTSDKQK